MRRVKARCRATCTGAEALGEGVAWGRGVGDGTVVGEGGKLKAFESERQLGRDGVSEEEPR